jgi:hypothetical protein
MNSFWPGLLVALALPLGAQNAALDEALLTAARRGNLEEVRALVEKGASIEAKTRYGQTPLYTAARNGHETVVRYLIDKGAELNIVDTFYNTPLLGVALSRDHAGVAKLLLEKGSKQGPAALQLAVQKGFTPVVEAILAPGNLTPEQLTSALGAAELASKPEIAALLRKAGAKDAPKPEFKIDVAALARFVGTYWEERVGEFAAVVKDGKLFLGPPGQSIELGAFDPVTFGATQFQGLKAKFLLEGERVTGLELTNPGGQVFKMQRVEKQP